MKKKRILIVLAIIAALSIGFSILQKTTYADDGCTNIIFAGNNCKDMDIDDVKHIVHIVLNVLTVGMVVGATVDVIICGYWILTARENTAQLEKGKKRLFEIVIGLALWFCAFGLVYLFIPNAENVDGVDQLPQGYDGGSQSAPQTPTTEITSGDNSASEIDVPAAKNPTGDEGTV